MYVIGITGGVGAGKSEVVHALKQRYDCITILADEVAKEIMRPGTDCFRGIVEYFGEEILTDMQELDRTKLASIVFQDAAALAALNRIVHPLVRMEIGRRIEAGASAGISYCFVESALPKESNFDEICDEIWYVYASESVRAKRLENSRGYSPQKSKEMMQNQSSVEDFRAQADVIIDNSNSMEDTMRQIQERLNLRATERK